MSNQTLSTTEQAAEIRQTLKAKYGWNSRMVSVRAEYFSMGSAIRVRIMDAKVKASVVREVATKAERIDRCEYTGEILSGGNRYVTVSYDSDVLESMGKAYQAAVEAAEAELKTAGQNALIPVAGTPYLIGTTQNGYGLSLWGHGRHIQQCYDVPNTAREIAVRMVA